MKWKCLPISCIYNPYRGDPSEFPLWRVELWEGLGHSHDHFRMHLSLFIQCSLFILTCSLLIVTSERGLLDLHYNTWHGLSHDFLPENTTIVYIKVCTALVLSEANQPEVNWFAGIKGNPALAGLVRSKSQDYNVK